MPVPYPPPVVAAAGAALMFALANVVQRRAAAAVPRASGGSVHLIVNLLRNRRWLFGSSCAVGGLVLQTMALAQGSLVVVQSILVSGVVVAVILDAGGDRRRPTWPELVGPALVVGGVVLLVLAGPESSGEAGLGQSFGGLLAVGIVGGGALAAARRTGAGDWTARLLGAAAGTCFSLDALFLKELVTGVDAHRTEVALIGVAGFALASVLGNLTLHRGYQLAPLRVVLPTLTGAEPIAAFLLGWLVLGEGLPGGLPAHLAAVLGIVGAVTGNAVVGLAEVAAVERPAHADPIAPAEGERGSGRDQGSPRGISSGPGEAASEGLPGPGRRASPERSGLVGAVLPAAEAVRSRVREALPAIRSRSVDRVPALGRGAECGRDDEGVERRLASRR